MSTSSLDTDTQFNFYPLMELKPYGFGLKSTVEALQKWALYDGMRIQGYSFDKPYKEYMQKRFVSDFFNSANVMSTFERITIDQSTGIHRFQPVININYEPDLLLKTKVEFNNIPCTQTSTAMFDKILEDELIIHKGSVCGSIKKCLEHYVKLVDGTGNPVLIANQLQKMLVKGSPYLSFDDTPDEYDYEEECESGSGESHSPGLSPEEKSEFLFKIFHHLVIGGSLCQYEDLIRPYLNVTKQLYKDLVSVSTRPQADDDAQPQDSQVEKQQDQQQRLQVQVDSIVFEITKVQRLSPDDYNFNGYEISNHANLLFARIEYNNFMYLVVDPVKRHCYTFYHHVL